MKSKLIIIAGNVVLHNLEVKSEALDSLNLPITVVRGMNSYLIKYLTLF